MIRGCGNPGICSGNRRIDGGPESRTVYGGIFDDIYDRQHGN